MENKQEEKPENKQDNLKNKSNIVLTKKDNWIHIIKFTIFSASAGAIQAGVFTLLFQVPVILGVLHQVVAFFLLAVMTVALHRFSK